MERKEQEHQTRSFDEVWAEIGPHIEREKQRRKNRRRIWTSVGSVCACAVVATAVILPITLYEKPEQPKLYLDDELSELSVSAEEFSSRLSDSKIPLVDITDYYIFSYTAYQTKENKMKGGVLVFADDENNLSYFINLRFYDKDVNVTGDTTVSYDMSYSTNSKANVEYFLDEDDQKYHIKAEYNSVKYYMEYTGSAEAITGFFEAFFD